MFGTFVASLAGSFTVRTILATVARKIVASTSSTEAATGRIPGLDVGAYEFHIVKTSHLGLCQVLFVR